MRCLRRRSGLLLLAAPAAMAAVACGGGGRHGVSSTGPEGGASTSPASVEGAVGASRSSLAITSTTTSSAAKPSASKLSTSASPLRPRPSPGSLPQTDQLPSVHAAVFAAEMRMLWRGVQLGSFRVALPAFFPEAAYVRLKRVPDARGDFRDRLVADFALDIEAAHRLLGARAPSARLVGVHVPAGYAHWIPPGVCYNAVGYYEVPNARILYLDGGQLQSLGIASMISWRGIWYVVHLGAVMRYGAVGVLDAPSSGPGVSVSSSTCREPSVASDCASGPTRRRAPAGAREWIRSSRRPRWRPASHNRIRARRRTPGRPRSGPRRRPRAARRRSA
jgi:hypothetical protein